MALTPTELAALVTTVAERITGTVLERESAAEGVQNNIAAAAVELCNGLAPGAPESILREAAIRLAGWLYGSRPHLAGESFKDPSGTEFAMTFNSAATANGLRASGAGAMLSRFIVRRGGAISRDAESMAD